MSKNKKNNLQAYHVIPFILVSAHTHIRVSSHTHIHKYTWSFVSNGLNFFHIENSHTI